MKNLSIDFAMPGPATQGGDGLVICIDHNDFFLGWGGPTDPELDVGESSIDALGDRVNSLTQEVRIEFALFAQVKSDLKKGRSGDQRNG